MSFNSYLWIAAGLLIVVVIGLLDGIKRRRTAERLARMTPEEREIAQREAKVFRSVLRRGR